MTKRWGCFLLLFAAGSAQAQTIFLKDGKTVVAKGVRQDGDVIMATVDLPGGTAGQPPPTGELGYPVAQIVKVDFPEPAQLTTAAGLINAGKSAEALKQLETAAAYYDNFRNVPGSWWVPITVMKMQALISLGRPDEADRSAERMGLAARGPEATNAAKVYVAAGLTRRGEHARALPIYDAVLKDAAQPQTLAAAALNKGLSHLARREWEAALLAMLEVPVFYPQQEVLLPPVLLNTGRAYIGLADYARAKASLTQLRSKFAATPEAAQAKTELDRVAKLENSPHPTK